MTAHESAARLREALARDTVSNDWSTCRGLGPNSALELGEAAREHLPALLAEHDARQWRTMDSAPRDGTIVWGLWGDRRLPALMQWRPDGGITGGAWCDVKTGWMFANTPAWWMPLPEVPHE